MSSDAAIAGRIVTSVHGVRQVADDPPFFAPMAAWLQAQLRSEAITDLYTRHMHGDDPLNTAMRAVIWRAVASRVGRGLQVGSGVGFKHLETFVVGEGVFIGAQSYLQGRFDGTFEIGDHVWIGPQSYFDARNLIIEEYVGWGPGARVLGSAHTAVPVDVPIIQTDLEIKPVRIEAWADIGTNAVILPGVTVGRGSIVGAGSVVTRDVPPFSIVAGVPARVIRERNPQQTTRDGQEPRLSADEQAVLQWTH
jgi:acetyltransferase-like isoleucine patch superfamily enzyme